MRPSPDRAGSAAGAFGAVPAGVWPSRSRGCMRRLSAWGGAAMSAREATAAGTARRIPRVSISLLLPPARPPDLGLAPWTAHEPQRPPRPPRRAAGGPADAAALGG